MPRSVDRPLGIALIGYAFMGRAHSQAWRTVGAAFDTPEVARRVVVGRDEAAVAEAARRLGWEEHSTDWRAVLEREDVDVVDVCTPGFLHEEIAIAALEAGKHVLCEKPLANDTAQAERMVEAAEAAAARGQVAALGHTYRRVPALAHARTLIAQGRLGEIREVRAAYLQDWLTDPTSPMSWRLRAETAGSGALGDIGSHAIDQVRFLTGQEVTAVRGRLRTFTPERPGPDGPEPVAVGGAAWAAVGLSGGAVGSVEASRVATGAKNSLTIEVYGSAGALRFDLESMNELWFLDATLPVAEQGFTRVLVTEPEHPYLEGWWPQGHVLGWEDAFTNQARDLLLAIRDGEPFSPTFPDGLALQRILDAVIASHAADGAAVTL